MCCLIVFFNLISGQAIVGECFDEFSFVHLCYECVIIISQKTVRYGSLHRFT